MIQTQKGVSLFISAIALSLCVFMQVLDLSIANVAIPYIAGDLAISDFNGTWVITMFTVGNAIVLPLTGWLTKRFGSVRVMIASTALFTLFSFFCGISISIEMLMAMRFIQGIVGGPLIPLSMSLMLMIFPPNKKMLAIAIWNMVGVVGPIMGPILGGWLTFDYSWPWIFFVNVPVGIVVVILVCFMLKGQETEITKTPVDWTGIFLLSFAISSLQIILDQGQQFDWWRSEIVRLLTVISLLSFLFLLLWELTEEHPIIELTLFKNRNFSLGVIIISISYMLFFGTLVVTPLWLQDYMGYTSLVAGLAVSTMGIPPFCTVLLVGMLMQRCRLRNLVIVSFFFFATAFFYFTRFDTDVSFEKIALSRLLLGCGLVTYIAPLMGITFAHFPNEKLASGQGIFHFLRILFGGIGASLFITVWDRRATYHHSNLVDSINHFDSASNKLFSSLAEYQIKGQSALEVVDNLAWKQAYMLSLNDLFWVSGWAFIILLFSCFLFKKRKAPLSFEVASH